LCSKKVVCNMQAYSSDFLIRNSILTAAIASLVLPFTDVFNVGRTSTCVLCIVLCLCGPVLRKELKIGIFTKRCMESADCDGERPDVNVQCSSCVPSARFRTMREAKSTDPVPEQYETIQSGYLGIIKSSSTYHGYGFITCSERKGDLIFFTRFIRDEDRYMMRSGNAARFDLGRIGDVERALNLVFAFDGFLKSFDKVRNHGFLRWSGASSRDPDVWFGRSDIATPNSCFQSGTNVRFQMYFGGNGRPRARNVEFMNGSCVAEPLYGFVSGVRPEATIQSEEVPCQVSFSITDVGSARVEVGAPVLFFFNAETGIASGVRLVTVLSKPGSVISYNSGARHGFVRCDGLKDDIWFTVKHKKGEFLSLTVGATVVVDLLQEEGCRRALRIHV